MRAWLKKARPCYPAHWKRPVLHVRDVLQDKSGKNKMNLCISMFLSIAKNLRIRPLPRQGG